MIDKFVSEGVLVSDNSCDFASPLVIVNERVEELEWRLIIGKLIYNWSLRPISFLINHLYFNVRVANIFFAKIDNLWGYHHLRLSEDSSKVTAIITPWGISLLTCPYGISTATGEYQARMAHEVLQDYYLKWCNYIHRR